MSISTHYILYVNIPHAYHDYHRNMKSVFLYACVNGVTVLITNCKSVSINYIEVFNQQIILEQKLKADVSAKD